MMVNETGSAPTRRDPLRHAFSSRRPLMPWRGGVPVPDAQIHASWAAMSAASRNGPCVAYVHVPFCATRCLFCGFYRHASSHAGRGAYSDQVLTEIANDARTPVARGTPISAVYLGGGTPSTLGACDLNRLLRALRSELALSSDCEITVEGRVFDFDTEKIDACIEAGANRFSIGIQSFDTTVRQGTGRRADGDTAIRFLADLASRDQAAVVCDLIFGLPGQTMQVWDNDLRVCMDLGIDGVDLYCLTVIPGTPLHRMVERGRWQDPKPADLAPYYARGAATLAQAGWRQISNSHWQRTTRERNRYNLLSKHGADCLAFGAGAGGRIAAHAYSVTGDLEAYARAVRYARKPLRSLVEGDALSAVRDAITGGIDEGRLDLGSLFASSPVHGPDLEALIDGWQKGGLIVRHDSVIELTLPGRFWGSRLAEGLIGMLTSTRRVTQPGAAPARRARSGHSNSGNGSTETTGA